MEHLYFFTNNSSDYFGNIILNILEDISILTWHVGDVEPTVGVVPFVSRHLGFVDVESQASGALLLSTTLPH